MSPNHNHHESTETETDDPRVYVTAATNSPDRVICQAARNDYFDGFVSDVSFAELMEGIEPDDQDIEWATDYLQQHPTRRAYTLNIKMWAQKRRLIRKLMERGHYGPFEHPQITFTVKGISRSCMAQLTRHRHASFDVQSMRYVSFDDREPGEAVVHIPELEDPGLCGRGAEFDPQVAKECDDDDILDVRSMLYWAAIKSAIERYEELLEFGVAPENARMVLPIGTKVNLVFSVNARMLMHIADMRAAADAQWEIRELTGRVLDLAHEWAPVTFDYYNEQMKGRKNRLAP